MLFPLDPTSFSAGGTEEYYPSTEILCMKQMLLHKNEAEP